MPYRNPAVVRELEVKYAREFAAIRAAIAIGDEFMGGAVGDYPRSSAGMVAGLLFTRAFNALRAALVLLEEGYPIEAGMLTRPLVDTFIDLCYIAYDTRNTPEQLADRFIAYEAVAQYGYYSEAKARGETVPEEKFARAKEGRREFAEKYKKGQYKGENDWSGLELWKKAQYAQVDAVPPGMAGDDQVTRIYSLLRPYLAEAIHGGPLVWRQIVTDEGGKVVYYNGPHDIETATRLVLPPLCFLPPVIVKAAADVFGLLSLQESVKKTLSSIIGLLSLTGTLDSEQAAIPDE